MRVRTIGTDGDSTKCPHRVASSALEDTDPCSESAIAEYWNRGAKACPSAGCDVMLSVSDWIPDVQLLKSLAKDKSRREARAGASQATQDVHSLDSDDETQVKPEVKPQTQAMVIDSDDE